jgi:DnaJ-class molecular chaperone
VSGQVIPFSEPCPVCHGEGAQTLRHYLPDGSYVGAEVRICGMCHGKKVLKTLAAYEAERKRAAR